MNEEVNFNTNNDYKLLLEEHNNLLLRLKNYSNIQQELIAANLIIDKQLENYKRLNNYIKIFVEADTIQSFKSKIPEAIIDVFNFESSMVIFEDKYHSAIYTEGFDTDCTSIKEIIFNSIKECSRNHVDRKSFFITRDELDTQTALNNFDRAVVVKFNCVDEYYYKFFLIGFVSKKGAYNYEAVKSEELIMFDNFSEQMYSILRQNIYKYNLNTEKEKYIRVIENMNLGLLELDKNDYILMPNNCFCDIFGYTKEELIGKSVFSILFEKLNKKGKKRQDNFINSIGIQEIEILTKKGEIRNLLFTSTSNYDTRGNIYGSIGIYLDITKTKELEHELSTSNIELKKINSELDTFVYRVTHDLRTPVLSITGLVDLIKYDSNKKVAENIELINLVSESTQRLDDTIQEILNYSRNARLNIEIKTLDIVETVTTIYNDIKFASNKKIDFECNFNSITHIEKDPYRLKKILKNIIGNAIKYSNPSIRNPNIKFKIEETAKKYYITISDNGLGIKEEHIDKIFKMFFRGTSKSVGTGLGLFIVKEAVEKLNGETKVASKFNFGTTFIIKLPKKY
jgi:PAS domain S-box-containing protein